MSRQTGRALPVLLRNSPLGSRKIVAILWKRASNTPQSPGEDEGGEGTLCPFNSSQEQPFLGRGSLPTILGVCALKVLLNQISKSLSNLLATQDSGPYSSLAITKILHFHNICYRLPLQCTASLLRPVNPLFVNKKLGHREGLALNHAPRNLNRIQKS